MYQQLIKKIISDYDLEMYTEHETLWRFVENAEATDVNTFMKQFESISPNWYSDFLLWFDRKYPAEANLDNLITFRSRISDEESTEKISAIRKWIVQNRSEPWLRKYFDK